MARYTIILSPDPDAGAVTAICPAMPGAITEGTTREEALHAMRGVMEVWIEMAAAKGYQPLVETPELVAAEIASVLGDRSLSGLDLTIETARLEPAEAVLV